MAYCTGKNIEIARGKAVNDIKKPRQLPELCDQRIVARVNLLALLRTVR